MARIGPSRAATTLLFLLVAIAKPASSDDKCRSGCQGAPQHFKYAEGTTYKYNLEGNIDISLSSAENQLTGSKIRATVLLSQLPQCNQLLRLQNVQVIGPDAKKYGQIADLEKPIRINFHDGHIEDVICTEPGDTQNSLNVKRAVASLFQAAIKHHHETDVFGLCPTEISTHSEGNVFVISKNRNLNRCAYRENIKQDFLATTFNLNSEIKSSPILNGDYNSEQRIKNGILDHAVVTEHYLYVPFSVGKNGAKAIVQTKIQYVGSSKDAPKSKVSEPRSIIFENPHPVDSLKTNVDGLLSAVKEAADSTDITEKTAENFVNLVRILRTAKKDDLLAVYNQVKASVGFKTKNTAKRVFLDALFRAGTGNTVEVAVELLKNNELNLVEQKLVYLGLAFVRHATEASLVSASGLLDLPDLPREAYLGVGTLAGRYCREHNCKNVNALNQLVQKLAGRLGDGKAANRQKENEIVAILKALGNIHSLNDKVLGTLTSIAQDRKAPNRIRVAALETYQADACKDKVRDSALSILKDIQQDSEIRIKAYLALAKCPNGKIANALKTLLEKEPSYQVGGFIVTHIRNLRASANPDKENAKQHLSQIHLPKRFPIDFRKYSFNGELSYSVDTLGSASSAETNVIYSQNSFLPRSTSLNLTTEVFGHTFNFLEVNARQENLDRLLEHYLGPLGVLRSTPKQKLIDEGISSYEHILNRIRDRFGAYYRSKRDVPRSEIDAIAKQSHIKTNDLNNDLDLDLSVKVFGSELLFLSLNEKAKEYKPEMVLDKVFNYMDKGVEHAKDLDHVFRTNLLFLDSEFSYPTSLGFPLKLSVDGSAALQLRSGLKLDVAKFFSQTEDGHFKIFLVPSANVEVSGRLTLDAQVVENGLKVTSSLYSSTGGDLNIDYFDKGKGLDVKFAFPLEKQKLISASHHIVFTTRELGQPEVNQPLKFSQNKDFSICLDQLSPLIGLTVCGEINGPNLSGKQVPVLPFPFSGNGKVALILEREDVSSFHYKRVFFDKPDKTGVEVLFETIGDKNDRKVGVQVEAFLTPEKYFKATLTSPIKSASAEARIISTATEKSLSGSFIHDSNEYYGKIGVHSGGTPGRTVYKPLLEYRTPADKAMKKPPYNVEGAVVLETKQNLQKYIFEDVKLVLPNQKKVALSGNIGRENDAFFTDLTINDGSNTASLRGRLQANPNLVKFNAELQNTYNPDVNVNVKGEMKRQPGQVDTSLQLITGKDLSSKKNLLTLTNGIIYKVKSSQDFHVGFKHKFSYPLIGVTSKIEYEQKPTDLDVEVELTYNELKFGSDLDLKYGKKHLGDYDLEFAAYYGKERVALVSRREIFGDSSKIDNALEILGKKYEVNGAIEHRLKPQDASVGTELVVKVPQHPNPIKVDSKLSYNPTDVDSFLKITSGSSVYADVFFKATNGGNANGSAKVNTEYIVIDGQIKATKGTGNGDIVVNFVKAGRKMKGEGTFTIADPIYNVVIALHPNYEKDTKKITLSTNNKVTPKSIDSKNFVDVFGNKLEANVQGSLSGEFNNGKLNGQFDVTLPCNHYFAGKYNREMKIVNGIANGHFVIGLEQRDNKNSPGRKVTLKGSAKDTHIEKSIFDVAYALSAENNNGKNINADLGMKRVPQGDKILTDVNMKVHGSVMPHPLETGIKATYIKRVGDYHAYLTYSPETNLNIDGKYDFAGQQKPYSGSVNVEFKTPNPALKIFKFNADGSVLRTDEVFELGGSSSVFVDDDGSQKDATVDAKISGDVKLSKHGGNVKGSVQYKKEHPLSLSASYGHADENGVGKCHCHASVEYGQGKNVKLDGAIYHVGPHEKKIEIGLQTPHEKAKNILLKAHGKRSEDGNVFNGDGSLTVNDKTYEISEELVLSVGSPSFSVKVKHPSGTVDEMRAKYHKVSEKEINGELKLSFPDKKFLIEASADEKFDTIDDFHVLLKVNADTPYGKIDEGVFEAMNKPNAKGAKRIQINVKSGDKNFISGSTNYKTRVEGDKFIVEGSGSFKVKEESKSGNFKYIRQTLSHEKNGERGVEISFNAGLGKMAVDAEFKATNKQFRILNSYCEETKQCAHIEVDSKTNVNEVNEYNHVLEIAVDLRKLGLSHEFGLKAVTNRKQLILDHTVDVHFQSPENSKYQYSLYLHPKEAGVSLTTPKRIIALEAVAKLPGKGDKLYPISGEVAFYIDKKNQPAQKTSLSGTINYDEGAHKVMADAKFTNPGLGRPLAVSYTAGKSQNTVSYEAVFDVFAKPNQKVIFTGATQFSAKDNIFESKVTYNVKSDGLNINMDAMGEIYVDIQNYNLRYSEEVKCKVGGGRYESAASVEASPREIKALLKLLNKKVLSVNSKMQISKEAQVVDSVIEVYGAKPVASHAEAKNFNTFKYTVGYKDTPNDKLQFSSALIPGQIADVRADITKGGAKTDLFHATIKLDDANFLKSDFGFKSDNIKNKLLVPLKEDLVRQSKEMKGLSEGLYKDMSEHLKQILEILKKATPNLKPVKDYYIDELKKIREEIVSDKTIKEISEFLKGVIGAVLEVPNEIIAKVNDLFEKVAATIQANFSKVIKVIETELLPKIRAIVEKVAEAGVHMFEQVSEVFFLYVAKVSEFLEAHQAELKQIATSISAVGQDLGRFIVKTYEDIRALITKQLQEIYNEIKALPIYEEMKHKYEELVKEGFSVSEALLATLQETIGTIKDAAPTPELKNLVEITGDYIIKKLKREKVDDLAAIDKIVQGTIGVVRTFLSGVYKAIVSSDFINPNMNRMPLLSFDFIYKLPRLVAIRLSPLSFLLQGDFPNVYEYLYSVTFNPKQWIPPYSLNGIIVQGQHIFTFDGKHMTFPGKCNYLLAHDGLDGNFTIVGTYTDGLLTAITLADKADSVTIKKGGHLLLNNAAHEFPVRKGHIEAFRLYESVHLYSKAGVEVVCGVELVACGIHISGYYHGRVRGLLGNGNNEPYDDFTLPNGKIVAAESDFGNAYKMSSSCPAVKTVDHHSHHPAPSCNELFSPESMMTFCYSFVDPTNYKMACEHGVAAGVKNTEHAVAVGYVAACNSRFIPIRVPKKFVQCMNGDKPYNIGDRFSVKLPGKAADVLILVDQVKGNEAVYKELIQPLVQQLSADFGSKGISDVEFHLITYGGEYHDWPSHVTVGGKLVFKGKSPNVKFSDNPKHQPLTVGNEKIDNVLKEIEAVINDIKLVTGHKIQAATYKRALKYPFRAHAVKSILAVPGNKCEVGRFFGLQLLHSLTFIDESISLTLFTPFDDLQLKDQKQVKEVIGFNDRNIFTFSNSKKKMEGSSELYKQLDYNDYCVDFTLKNRGNVFVSNNFQQAKGNNKKQFVQVASHNIVDQLVNVEQGVDCECKYASPYTGENVCRVVHSKDKSAAKKAGTKS